MYRKIFSAVLLISIFFVFSGCESKKETQIVFDDSYPLALVPNVLWAVVTDPYVSYRVTPEWGSSTSGHCRRGEILQVMGRSDTTAEGKWVNFENGWLPESCVSVFSNRYKAQSFKDQLK